MRKFYNWLTNKEGKSEGVPQVALPTLIVGVGGGTLASIAAALKGDIEVLGGTLTYTLLSGATVAAMYDGDQPGTWLFRNFGGLERLTGFNQDEAGKYWVPHRR